MEKVPTKGRERELTGGPETVLTIAMEEVLTLPMENLLDIHNRVPAETMQEFFDRFERTLRHSPEDMLAV